MGTLLLVLAPALLLPLCMAAAGGSRLPALLLPSTWPVEFVLIALSGSVATVAGVLDWRFHRGGGRIVPPAERRMEFRALILGSVLFGLLAAATSIEPRGWLLAPIAAVALWIAWLVRLDERRFHRACGRYETTLHRLLVGGNGLAFLGWCHWCFVRGAPLG